MSSENVINLLFFCNFVENLDMSYFKLEESYYRDGEACACKALPHLCYFYKTTSFIPKTSIFSSNLQGEGVGLYCLRILILNDSSYKKNVYFYKNGVNTDVIFKGWSKWIYIPKKYKNNKQEEFRLPVKIWNGKSFEFGVYSIPFAMHHYFGETKDSFKLTSEAVAVLFGYIEYSVTGGDRQQQTAEGIKKIYNIAYTRISETEYNTLVY